MKNSRYVPEWLKRGRHVWAQHLTVPPTCLRRGGDFHELSWKLWKTSHSEGLIKWLAEVGVNNITTHFFVGHGLAAEAEPIKLLRRLLSYCRRYGIKVNASIQLSSMLHEDLMSEVPQASTWAATGRVRRAIACGGKAYQRRTCPCNPEWREYLKKCLAFAINELKADGIFLDGFSFIGDNRKDEASRSACHCEWCLDSFRSYLSEKHKNAPGVFGIKSFDHVLIPEDISNVGDPIVREYLSFLGYQLLSVLREFYLYAKMFKNDVAVITNSSILPWHNPYEYANYNEAVFWQDGAYPHWEDGCMITQIHPCKVASALNVGLIKTSEAGHGIDSSGRTSETSGPYSSAPGPEPRHLDWRLLLAEGLAFAGSASQLPPLQYLYLDARQGPAVSEARRYIDFFRENSRLFEESAAAATIALYYSSRALVRDFAHHWAALRGMEQILAQNGLPFELIFPEEISEKLEAFDVLIMPDVPLVGPENEQLIRRWVAGGGGLYASGRTSLCDDAFQRRPEYGLADVFGTNAAAGAGRRSTLSIHRFKKGRVCFVSSVPEKAMFLDKEGKPFRNVEDVSYRDLVKFALPPLHGRIARTIKELASRPMPVEVVGPISVATEACCTEGALVIHLVNYEQDSIKRNVLVKIHPRHMMPPEVLLYSPDADSGAPERLKPERCDTRFEIIVPRVQVYSILEVGKSQRR